MANNGTTGHESEAIDVQGLKASLQKLKTDIIDPKYAKPSGGIPKADLAQTVQDTLDAALYPVNVDTLTPSSTFVKNAIIGINGVIYKAKRNTSNLPVTLTVQDGAFVVNIINGKKAFVVSSSTINSDWEIWTDAAIEYWTSQLDARTTALETATAALQSRDSVLDGRITTLEGITGVITVDGNTYTARELLTAMASMMNMTIVTQP